MPSLLFLVVAWAFYIISNAFNAAPFIVWCKLWHRFIYSAIDVCFPMVYMACNYGLNWFCREKDYKLVLLAVRWCGDSVDITIEDNCSLCH